MKKETKQEKKQMRGERERSNESLRHSIEREKEREKEERGGLARSSHRNVEFVIQPHWRNERESYVTPLVYLFAS